MGIIRYIVALLFLVQASFATTYYVDFEAGNDASAGTSTGTAWKTIPGTRNVANSDYVTNSYGGGTVSTSAKVQAGDVFKIKSGTTYDTSVGSKIWIHSDYYVDTATLANPITIQRDATWSSGAVTFDGSGIDMTGTGEALFEIIDLGGIAFDGVTTNGFVIRDSERIGIMQYLNSITYSAGCSLRFCQFYGNGTHYTGIGAGGGGSGQLYFGGDGNNGERTIGTATIEACEFDGAGFYFNGTHLGQTANRVTNAVIANCTAHGHRGDDATDEGIGFKAQNSQVTYTNCVSFSNDKGSDNGEEFANDAWTITYKFIACSIYSNFSLGIGFSNSQRATQTTNANYYVLNCLIYDNTRPGVKAYSSPFNLFVVGSTFHNNGHNLLVHHDGVTETNNLIRVHVWNNISYQPTYYNDYSVGNFDVGRWSDLMTTYTLDSDYNSWFQTSTEPFSVWNATGGGNGDVHEFNYGADGPGHAFGSWFNWRGWHNDEHSKGTGANNTTAPPFASASTRDYTLTAPYRGVDLSGKSWYIADMGKDKTGAPRSSWTMGAYEFIATIPIITAPPQSQVVVVSNNATLSVDVEGAATLSYQWRQNGSPLSGASTSVLTLNSLTPGNAGNYDVVVTNGYGVATSSNAVLQVLPTNAPSITLNGMLAVGTVTVGDSATATIMGGFPGGLIFYTLDGSMPSTAARFYANPFLITNNTTLRAMSLSADFTQSSEAPAINVVVLPVYSLATSVSGAGVLTVSPLAGPYISNSVVTLTAQAATNWAFDHWSGDVSGSANPVSVTMNGPRSVQATFVQTAYPLTLSTPGGGSVTADGQTISANTYYPTGTVVQLQATANGGWSFIGWQGGASGTNNPLGVTMNQAYDIQAVFGTFVSTNTTGGGKIVLSQQNPVPFGTALTASAVPDAGQYFVAWSGDASGPNAPTTLAVTSANPNITALFSTLPAEKYSLGVVVIGNGLVAISPQQSYHNAGASVTLSATTTNAGISFNGWTQDASGTDNPIAVQMNTNKIIQANFVATPTVSISPLNLIVVAESNAVLSANAFGLPPLSYQWHNSQGAIANATNATFAISNAQPTNAGNYSVVVSNPFGSVTSAVATVTVVFLPSITLQPLGQTVAAGTMLTLDVSAQGTAPLNYQWLNHTGVMAGQTTNSLIFNPAQTNQTDSYSVIVSNAYGVVTSSVAAVFVYLPVGILAQPASRVVPASAPASFGVIASGFPAPTSYQWTHNGSNLTGATSNTFTINEVRLTDTGSYQVLVGNGYSSTNSDFATLFMSPSLTSPFVGATTIWGRNAALSVGAIGSGQLVYQWYKDGMPIQRSYSATLNFTNIQFTNSGLYSVVVSSTFGVVTNGAAEVVVNPAGVALGFSPTISLGFSPTISISGVAGYSYIIQRTSDLTDTNAWLTLTNLILTQPVEIWVDTNVDVFSALSSKHFYRVLPGQ